MKFGETGKCTEREAYKGIAIGLAYIIILLGFIYVATNYWGWF